MITLVSPAKINLFLQILHQRPDGYHELASLFQAISLHDTIQYSLSTKDSLTCTVPDIPVDSSNLILKAVNLFRLTTNLKFNISIHLEKHIPQKAGPGGGSSNAATTLFALNELFNHPLSIQELENLGSQIGSDVAFFFSEGTAYCTGRGEVVENLKPLPVTKLWIAKPNEGLATPLIFKNFQMTDALKKNPQDVLRNFLNGKPDYYNDLEPAAFRALPALETFKNDLKKCGFKTVLMSGSGSAFFCINCTETIDYNAFTFIREAHFLTREKNKWYQNTKMLH